MFTQSQGGAEGLKNTRKACGARIHAPPHIINFACLVWRSSTPCHTAEGHDAHEGVASSEDTHIYGRRAPPPVPLVESLKCPTFEDMMLPLLSGIKDGREHSMDDLERMMAESLDIPNDVMNELTPNRQMTKVRNRVGWAKSYLKKAGLVHYPSRGLVAITEEGRGVLTSNPRHINRKYLDNLERENGAGNEETKDGDSDLTPEETIMRGFDDINSILESDLLEKVRGMTPRGFELMVLDLCKKMNADARSVHTGGPGDGGIDGIITLNDGFGLDKIYVQAKKHKNQITGENVRAFMGVLSSKPTKKGIFITTAEIPESVREEAKENENVSVKLINGSDLVRLMIDYNAGVVEDQTVTIKKMHEGYFEGFG